MSPLRLGVAMTTAARLRRARLIANLTAYVVWTVIFLVGAIAGFCVGWLVGFAS